jgi:hypothetical protein
VAGEFLTDRRGPRRRNRSGRGDRVGADDSRQTTSLLLEKQSRQICAGTQGQQRHLARRSTGERAAHRDGRIRGWIRERAAHRDGRSTAHREGRIHGRAGQGGRICGASRAGAEGRPDPRRSRGRGSRIRDCGG